MDADAPVMILMLPNEFDMVGPAVKGYRQVETAKKLDIGLDEGASQTSRRAFLEYESNNESMNVRLVTRTLYQDTAVHCWQYCCPPFWRPVSATERKRAQLRRIFPDASPKPDRLYRRTPES